MKLFGKEAGESPSIIVSRTDWRDGNVVQMEAMSNGEADKARRLKEDGHSDTQIWNALHRIRTDSRVSALKTAAFSLQLSDLSTEQLALLLESVATEPMSSLRRMNRSDLIRLVRLFGRSATIDLSA